MAAATLLTITHHNKEKPTMEITALATAAVLALTPYVKKTLEEFAGEAGKFAFEKIKSLYLRLEAKFKGDMYMQATFDRFTKNPEEYAPAVEKIIQEAAEGDDQFANEIRNLIAEIESAGPSLKVTQRIKKARKVLGISADELTNTSAQVEQQIDEAHEVTGIQIHRIGGDSRLKK